MSTLPSNAIEIRNPLNATDHPGARIGYTARAGNAGYQAWSVDFDDDSTDTPAPVYLGSFMIGKVARFMVENAYATWARGQGDH